MSKTYVFRLAVPATAALLLVALSPAPVRADFFDDMRKTFTSDIPHFFQDDVPCAFGSKPTSGTRTACKGSAPAQAQPAPAARQVAPPDVPPPSPPASSPPQDTHIDQQPLPPR
jgi:hypothetical protein